MSQLKLTADGGGGTVAIKGPASTTGNAAIELTVPGTSNATLLTSATSTGKVLQVVQVLEDLQVFLAHHWVNFRAFFAIVVRQ